MSGRVLELVAGVMLYVSAVVGLAVGLVMLIFGICLGLEVVFG